MKQSDVELTGIHKGFGTVKAVDDVSLSIAHGEFVTLLGPSGCGKTTLLRLIAGFEVADSGTVRLCGADVTRLPPYKRSVTTVFQHYALFPHMTVFENVAFGLRRRGTPQAQIEKKVQDALEMVRLEGRQDRMSTELSGGQQQRVALARSLVLEPPVLLLDEPLAALDRKLREEMRVELKGLQRRLGISFLFVTHDQEEALALSDRVVVMNAGKIEQEGSPEDIYRKPRTRFVADFIGQSNLFEAEPGGVDGRYTLVKLEGKTLEIGTRVAREGIIRFVVRPENVRIGSADPDSSDAGRGLRGTVEQRIYLGGQTQWIVKLVSGRTVLASVPGEAGDARCAVGQEVSVSWEASSAVVLED